LAAVNAVGRAAGLERIEPLEDSRARELYERHASRVLAYCRSRLRRREDAEDAVQTTFLHAVNGLRRGDVPSHELAWLLGIARNVCLSRLESTGRRGKLELVCDPVDLERSAAPSGRNDELIGLEDALARLPEQQRRAVLLRDWRGLSYEEVAGQLGVTLANAETLIFRGRRTLAQLLREEPAATRSRLASLGNAGSLLAWAKATLGGGAAAAKIAAATAVVAVAGGGVVAATGVLQPERPKAPAAPARTTPAAPAPAFDSHSAARRSPGPAPRATVSQGSTATPRATPGSRPAKPVAKPIAEPVPAAPADAGTGAPTAAGDTVSQGSPAAPATPRRTGPAGRAPAADVPVPKVKKVPAPPVATPAVPEAVGSTVDGVQETVEQAVPALAPVTEPVLDAVEDVVESVPVPAVTVETPPVVEDAVEDVVEALPPVTVTPPAPLPVGPVTIDPPKLLP
jgi:RNA polymerase sigma factor (sigma-70 family)